MPSPDTRRAIDHRLVGLGIVALLLLAYVLVRWGGVLAWSAR